MYITEKKSKHILKSDYNSNIIEKHNFTYARNSTILPEMIGKSYSVHSGMKFVKINITEHNVGYKLGEFVSVKKRALYKKKKKH